MTRSLFLSLLFRSHRRPETSPLKPGGITMEVMSPYSLCRGEYSNALSPTLFMSRSPTLRSTNCQAVFSFLSPSFCVSLQTRLRIVSFHRAAIIRPRPRPFLRRPVIKNKREKNRSDRPSFIISVIINSDVNILAGCNISLLLCRNHIIINNSYRQY